MKAFNTAQQHVDALRRIRAEFEQERAAIQANPNYSDSFKQKLIQQAKQYAAVQAEQVASNGHKALKQGKAQAIDELRAATLAKDAGINPHLVMLKAEEYRLALRTAPGDAARLKVLDRLVSEAQYSRETRRALALASGDLLGTGDFAQRASQARQTLTAWAEEEAAPRVQAERELNAYDPAIDEQRAQALGEEEYYSGTRRYSGYVSPWQKSIYSESAESLGHVVWRDDTSEYMKQAVPTPPAPSGIQE